MTMTPEKPRTLGDTAFVDVEFFDLLGARAEPTTVEVDIDPPDGDPFVLTYGTDAQITHDPVVVGKLTLALVLDQSGRYAGRWRGAGAVAAVSSFTIYVADWP